jgi:hypothetical protein
MSDNHLKPGSAKHIANLPNLTALNLSNNALGHDGMRHLLKLKKLESVQLKDNELKTDYVADRYHAEEYRKQLLRK